MMVKSPTGNALVLRNVRLFEGMDAAALGRIAAGASEVNAPGKTVIFRRGDPCHGLYATIFGQVKLALPTPQGSEKVVELVGAGGNFGETAIFLDRPYVLTAETLAASKLVHVPKATVLAELERTPGFAQRIIASLSRRLQHVTGALEDCMLHSGIERVIGYLLKQLPDGAANGKATIVLSAKKGIIASQLNLTQEHFSRILRELATERLIEVAGRSVLLQDADRLRARLGRAALR